MNIAKPSEQARPQRFVAIPTYLVSATCDKLLQALVCGEAVWCCWSPSHGQRQREAAQRLVDCGLARIIPRGVDGEIYVVIPPNAEWDFKRDFIAQRQPAKSAEVPR